MENKRFCAAEIQALLPLVWEVFLTRMKRRSTRSVENRRFGVRSTTRNIFPPCAPMARMTAGKRSVSS